MKQWGLDARSKGQPRPLPYRERHREIEDWKALARANGTSRRASGVGG
jgi:hypothetical protein